MSETLNPVAGSIIARNNFLYNILIVVPGLGPDRSFVAGVEPAARRIQS